MRGSECTAKWSSEIVRTLLLRISIFRNCTSWNSIRTFTIPWNFPFFLTFPGIPSTLSLPPGIFHFFLLSLEFHQNFHYPLEFSIFSYFPWSSINTFTTPWNFPFFLTFPGIPSELSLPPGIFHFFLLSLEFHQNFHYPLSLIHI